MFVSGLRWAELQWFWRVFKLNLCDVLICHGATMYNMFEYERSLLQELSILQELWFRNFKNCCIMHFWFGTVASCIFDLDHAVMIHPSRCHLHVFFNVFYEFYPPVSSNVAMENHPSIVDLHLRTSIYSRWQSQSILDR